MKHIYLLAALALTGGCLTSTEKVSRSTLDIMIGTNHIKSSTPKEYKIQKLQWDKDGFTVEGLNSAVNVNAVEAQVQQAQMAQQSFGQGMQMFQLGMSLAAQYFSGGHVNQPQVITNYIQLPPQIITNYIQLPTEPSVRYQVVPTVQPLVTTTPGIVVTNAGPATILVPTSTVTTNK